MCKQVSMTNYFLIVILTWLFASSLGEEKLKKPGKIYFYIPVFHIYTLFTGFNFLSGFNHIRIFMQIKTDTVTPGQINLAQATNLHNLLINNFNVLFSLSFQPGWIINANSTFKTMNFALQKRSIVYYHFNTKTTGD